MLLTTLVLISTSELGFNEESEALLFSVAKMLSSVTVGFETSLIIVLMLL